MKVIVDGIATEYKDEGQGLPIVMLHGWKHSLEVFDGIMPELRGYRIIRIDLPGFGGSEVPPKAWCVADYVHHVACVLERLDIQPFAIVGHSFGGRVIIKGMSERNLSAQKIVLIASAGNAKRNTYRLLIYKTLAKIGKAIAVVFPALGSRLRASVYAHAGSDYGQAGALKDTFRKVVHEDLRAAAALIHTPALLIWGEQDDVTPLSDGTDLARVIPGSALEIVPGAGHNVHIERPRDVAEMVRRFI